MNTRATINPYKRHRFPSAIIAHGVWLSFRFCLSSRDVEERLFARGGVVSYEAIRNWCRTFGQAYANQLRHRRPQPGEQWHLDEVVLTIQGERHYLWRAVDQDGKVLEMLVHRRRDKDAAKTFFRKLLKGVRDVPRVIITDQLASDGAATCARLPSVEHRPHRYRNHRAEHSHQPTRQRARARRRVKSAGHAPRFRAAYGPMISHLRPRRHQLRARTDRAAMIQRCQSGRELTGTSGAAS
jgi:putative transposase